MRQITKEVFDSLYSSGEFAVGPYRDSFGDGHYDPYRPYRRIWGTLKNGEEVESHTRPRWKPGDPDW